ncbi:MAG: Na+/galactose cotransporter [Acidobacteriota bacterium]|nr:Na+/galactose cotransporter [Acidobacteriota bacterium]
MPNLSIVDWLILLLYLGFVVGIGFALKRNIKTSRDFFQAGRALPAWVCGLALLAASLGAQEVIAMGAAGARYGLRSAQFYAIGVIPAMLFLGLFMMPLYYGSKARTVPEFLRLRFDEKTRALNAVCIVALTVFSSGISMVVMARLLQALHVFDSLFYMLGWPAQGSFTLSIAVSAIVVFAYVFLSGLAGAIYSQVLQFFFVVAGFLPMVFLGLRQIGGWSGLKAAVPAAYLPGAQSVAHTAPGNLDAMGLGLGLGIVLGAGYWCTDFRVIQAAMAAETQDSARRAPLIAAILKLFLPFLLILPGLVAIGLPTPHTTTATRVENGAIYHEITVVPRAAEEGRGLVPARMDPATGKPMQASGLTQLNYDMATPQMLLHFLPTGLLGLGLTGLLACLMGGMAANATALNAVFTCDLYQPYLHKGASDRHYLWVGRWVTLGGMLLSVGIAFAAISLHDILDTLVVMFALVNAPLLATFLLGMFWKRATGHGAFAGLAAGIAAAVLHQGLTLPVDAQRGIHGGWIAALHRYPSGMEQSFWTAIFAFCACLLVTVAVSSVTRAKPETELAGLVYSLTPKPRRKQTAWWKRPEGMAVAILMAAIALSFIFA